MTKLLNRWLPSLTLGVWGGILLYFHLGGRLAAFLHPSFRPGVLIAGCVLLLLALGSAIGGVGGNEECCEEDACGHGLTRLTIGKLLSFAALLLPVTLALAFSRDAFSLTTFENRGVLMDASAWVRQPSDEAKAPSDTERPSVSPIDLLYAAQDEGLQADFEGKTVDMIGQLMATKENNPHGDRMRVVRMFMTCCAADAKPVGVLIALSGPSKVPELSWVRVTGVPSFIMEGGRKVVVLKASAIEITDPPEESMLY